MSRAMNVALTEADETARCKKAGVSVSAIETLPSGGTHLVTTTSEGAEEMRQVLAKHIIPGRVKRFAFYNLRHSQ
jgi:hypothetical protein